MKKRQDYKGFIVDITAEQAGFLWTWTGLVKRDDGTTLENFIPEGPEVHRSAESALHSGIANGKKRVDGFLHLPA
jgi:phenylpropionate dioxygenase-like ring-hydroxylating dioxygenase large terminal subunit